MPMFDRASCSIPSCQIYFIDAIIQHMVDAWDEFIYMPEMVHNMDYNYTQWKLFKEQGINTLSDIKRKQLLFTNEGLSNVKFD